MAQFVGGFLMPHDPLITSAPEMADPKQAENIYAAFAKIKQRVADLKADVVITVGDDHYTMFGPDCLPTMLIPVGDIEGPIENFLRIPRKKLDNHIPLAEHIMNTGFDEKFDWAVAKTLVLDHAAMIPIHMAVPEGVKVIPLYVAAGVIPVIRTQRCIDLGQMIRRAVESFPGNERIVIFGTGGISHWVGDAQMGRVNTGFDEKVLKMIELGDYEGLAAMPDDYVLEQGGNGALEIRNFIVAMAAFAPKKATVLAYEPMPPWITGLGLAELAA